MFDKPDISLLCSEVDWDLHGLLKIDREEALEYLDGLKTTTLVDRLFRLHALEQVHHWLGRERDDPAHYKKAFDSAWEGVQIARKEGFYLEFIAIMTTNIICDAGNLELDIRDKLPELRLILLEFGSRQYLDINWWKECVYFFANLRLLDMAGACRTQFLYFDPDDTDEARLIEACLSAIEGKGISELSQLRNKMTSLDASIVDTNLKYLTGSNFKPLPPKNWRDYKPRGKEWFEFVLDRNMDALALALDVLEDSGDPRLALAVESLRQCNSVLDQAAMQEPGELEDDEDPALEID